MNIPDRPREPVVQANFSLFVAVDSLKFPQLKEVRSIPELTGFILGELLGHGWAKEHLAGLEIYWLPTVQQIWKLLLVGRVDAVVENEWVARYDIKRYGFQDRIVETPHPMTQEPVNFYFFIGKKSPYIKDMDRIDEVIKEMREDGSLKQIYDNYR